QVGHTLVLTFTEPTRTTDGRRLSKPIGVDIFRNTGPAPPASPDVMTTQKPWVVISPHDLARFNRDGKIRFSHTFSPAEFARSAGWVHTFAVLTLTRGFRGRPRKSSLSNSAQIEILNLPPPVDNLQATETRGAVDLRWSPPSQSLGKTAAPVLTGYKIYRSAMEEPHSFELAASTQSPRYQDTHFEFGATYSYKVRAVFTEGQYTAETADSGIVRITPRQIFPPSPPAGLAAVFTGHEVQLIWKPEEAPGVQGYNIYRQSPGAPPRRLNEKLLRIPAYADDSVSLGVRYSYWVTAVDKEQNESAPSTESTVQTQ
ncbi:MAG: fibronectin type III domain-containing protein, partial [Acidobacteriota bacterium]|nr:fibronectin type III domain-containing protein [Acidobacteriota bacterium]